MTKFEETTVPSAIHALTSTGRPVMVSPASISALMPNSDDLSRTTLVVDGELLSTDGPYEDWMQTFASSWGARSI